MAFPLARRGRLRLAALGLAAALAVTACTSSSTPGRSSTPGPTPQAPDESMLRALATGDNCNKLFQRGNQLWVCVHNVQLRDAVYYRDGETFFVVKPKQTDTKIAVVDATVGNDRSNAVFMNVDSDGYTLLDRAGKEYQSIDPFSQEVRQLAPSVPRTEGLYQVIWGKFEIQNQYGIRGAALFEVPKTVTPNQFRWNEVDTVYVRFEDLK